MDDIACLNPVIARVRTDVSAIKRNGRMSWTREPITEERLKEHLNGGASRGVCPIKAGESTTMLALLDLDSHKGETPWDDMIIVAQRVCAEIVNHGMNPIAWRSSGGKGIHIFVIWATPQDAYSVREFLRSIIGDLGYKNGTAGVARKEIEIFPKQDNVPPDGFGNQFILPMAGKSVPLQPSSLMLMSRADASTMIWPVSPSVPIEQKPERPVNVRVAAPDLDKLREILSFLDPNTGYDEWLKIGMAIHYETNGSDEGLDLWDEWSNQEGANYPGYDKLKEKWKSFQANRVRPVTIGTLISLARQKGMKEDAPVLDQADHSGIAHKIIDAEFRDNGGHVSLLRTQGQWFSHESYCYKEREEESVRAKTRKFLDRAFKIDANGQIKPFRPSMTHISAVTDALRAATWAEVSAPPVWLDNGCGNPRDYISMQNGLLHIPTRTLQPHTAEFFTLNAVPYDYVAENKPVEWLKFLDSVWDGDEESKNTLQEMFGYLLTADTAQQKMFLLKGPKRSGKGTIGRVIKEMLGAANVCGPTLTGMASNFGMQPLIGKLAAIIPDARVGGQTNKQAIVEKLLMVSGDDNVTVDRKHIEAWTGRMTARIVIMTNETPQLGDSSGALASRFIVLAMHKSFFGQEDTELEVRLLKEMPQIFCWALEGLERLRERGKFIQPSTAASTVQELSELNSPILDFVNSHCEIGGDYRVSKELLYGAYKIWCAEQGRAFPVTLGVFSRDLAAAFPMVTPSRLGTDGNRVNVFSGIRIKEREPKPLPPNIDVLSQVRQIRQGDLPLHT